MLVKQNLQAQLEARPDEDTLLNHAKSWSYDFYTNLIHWHACNFKLLPLQNFAYKQLSNHNYQQTVIPLWPAFPRCSPVHFDRFDPPVKWGSQERGFEPKQVWGRSPWPLLPRLCNCYLTYPNVIPICWMFFCSRFNMHHFYIITKAYCRYWL